MVPTGSTSTTVKRKWSTALGHRRTSLSVYMVQRDQLERVVAALALTRDNLTSLDLAMADASILSEHSIKEDATLDLTPDQDVNDWHRDLIELSIGRLAKLATAIRARGTIHRFQPRHVLDAVRSSINGGHIELARLKASMSASLQKKGII